ncbi:hypothetical protein ACFQRK_09365 [Parapedobacter sp. GCM10030251]|uniref:hypothetical protein n=1 Tax=Parapedobacter sp. GCM10030251 TaxID=3273419 RepID=UPI003614DC06
MKEELLNLKTFLESLKEGLNYQLAIHGKSKQVKQQAWDNLVIACSKFTEKYNEDLLLQKWFNKSIPNAEVSYDESVSEKFLNSTISMIMFNIDQEIGKLDNLRTTD